LSNQEDLVKRLIAVTVLAFLAAMPATVTAQFTDWSAPVSLGPVVNSPYIDSCVTISKDGLSLIFSSTRLAGSPFSNALRDLFVSKRGSRDADWGPPQPLHTLNTADWESCPMLSLDEHQLYFTSNRPGGCGNQDIWVSRRHDRRDDLGWQPPVNLGCAPEGPNTEFLEVTPAVFEDQAGRTLLYFFSNRGGLYTHWQSELGSDDTFGPATLIEELAAPAGYYDQGITVRRDGLEAIFLSDRPTEPATPYDGLKFWAATRSSTDEPWSPPVLVHSLGLSPGFYAQGKISLSFDGRELYFTSYAPGVLWPDIWVATREFLRPSKK
jgi:hypothetical protein